MDSILKTADSYLSVLHTNPYVYATLTIFLILYAGMAAPKLPPYIASLFENTIFKVLIMFLILAVRNYNPTVALLVAVGFLISMQTLSKYRIFTMANDLNLFKTKLPTLSSLHTEKFDESNYPGAGPEYPKQTVKITSDDKVHPPSPSPGQVHLLTSEPTGYSGRDLASYGTSDSEL